MSVKRMTEPKLVPTSQGQCIWVDAGVISYRLCTLNYDCERCSLHQALVDGPELVQPNTAPLIDQAEIEKQRAEFDRLFRKLPAEARKCRYMLTGDVSYKLCIDSFRCAICSYGQLMEDSLAADMDPPAEAILTIEGLRLAGGMHYHRGHTWVRVEREGDVRVGLDDFGQRMLGTILDIHLPGPGQTIYQGAPACELCLEQGQIDVPTPVTGRVMLTNTKLIEKPGLVNESPYTSGWLYTIKPPNLPLELLNLLYGKEARRWFEFEIERARERTGANHNRGSLPPIEKGALWRKGRAAEMANEFLLATPKKAA